MTTEPNWGIWSLQSCRCCSGFFCDLLDESLTFLINFHRPATPEKVRSCCMFSSFIKDFETLSRQKDVLTSHLFIFFRLKSDMVLYVAYFTLSDGLYLRFLDFTCLAFPGHGVISESELSFKKKKRLQKRISDENTVHNIVVLPVYQGGFFRCFSGTLTENDNDCI